MSSLFPENNVFNYIYQYQTLKYINILSLHLAPTTPSSKARHRLPGNNAFDYTKLEYNFKYTNIFLTIYPGGTAAAAWTCCK